MQLMTVVRWANEHGRTSQSLALYCRSVGKKPISSEIERVGKQIGFTP